jgi:RNA 2',3'-cyclic 3'-phosphodiesterase
MPRLFTAIVPPATVRDELAGLVSSLPGLLSVTSAKNIHLTLRFIGETPEDRQIAFAEALARVRVEPFILPVANTGVFPPRGPAKVLWAGAGNAHPRLFQLRKQVDEALLRVDPGLDVHHFHPHFTLGRLPENYDTKLLAKFLERYAGFEAAPFRVDEFHLLASERSPEGPPRYRSVGRFALG